MSDTAAASTLISHVDTSKVTREQLEHIATPEGTDTFKPVPHIVLVNSLEDILHSRGIHVTREQLALRHDGSRLFGTFDLSRHGDVLSNDTLPVEVDGTAPSLGFRAANDRSMPIQIVAGLRVFVCDNLALNGDMVALRRKHTSGLDLQAELIAAIDRYEQHYGRLVADVRQLQDRAITDDQAKAMIYDLVYKAEALPIRLGGVLGHEYFEPKHKEFEPRTAWSLHNACTETIKQITGRQGMNAMPLQMTAAQKVGQYFGLLGNVGRA